MQELDDMALLRAYADGGSEDAFGELVARHVNKVYSVALRQTGNSHQAEEITQAVFVILARKSRGLRQGTVLAGWLYKTARLTSLAAMRSDQRRALREQEAYRQSLSHEETPDPWPQMAPLLDHAIASLNETDRHAVVLRYLYGKDVKEVGAVLGAKEGAIRLRLHRATDKLRRFFNKRGVASTSEILAGTLCAHAVQTAPAGLAQSAATLALAKVPATSVSIIPLIKGALKIMAWTQAKTAIVTGAIVLVAAGTTPFLIKSYGAHAIKPPTPRMTAATGSIKGQFFGRGQLIDAGNTTAEDAWETRYWARAQGDYDAVIAATDREGIAIAKKWMGDKATFGARSRESFAKEFQGFQILARKELAADKVELKYQFAFQDPGDATAAQQTKIVTMIKIRGAWICGETRTHDVSWDAGSQPEPQS